MPSMPHVLVKLMLLLEAQVQAITIKLQLPPGQHRL